MQDLISYFKDKKNLINLLLLLVLVAGLPLGIRLANQQQIFKSRAGGGADVRFLTEAQGGTNCVVQRGGNLFAVCKDVKVMITSPFGGPAGSNASATTSIQSSSKISLLPKGDLVNNVYADDQCSPGDSRGCTSGGSQDCVELTDGTTVWTTCPNGNPNGRQACQQPRIGCVANPLGSNDVLCRGTTDDSGQCIIGNPDTDCDSCPPVFNVCDPANCNGNGCNADNTACNPPTRQCEESDYSQFLRCSGTQGVWGHGSDCQSANNTITLGSPFDGLTPGQCASSTGGTTCTLDGRTYQVGETGPYFCVAGACSTDSKAGVGIPGACGSDGSFHQQGGSECTFACPPGSSSSSCPGDSACGAYWNGGSCNSSSGIARGDGCFGGTGHNVGTTCDDSACGAYWNGGSCNPSSGIARGDGCFGGTGHVLAPSSAPTSSPRVSAPPGSANTCKGETKTWAQIDSDLKAAGFNGPFDHSQTELAAYNRAACPNGTSAPRVTTAKYKVGQPDNLGDPSSWPVFDGNSAGQKIVPWTLDDQKVGTPQFVEAGFQSSGGNVQTARASITFEGPDPVVTGCSPTLDTAGGVLFDIVGIHFGATQGTSKVTANGSNTTIPNQTDWTDTTVKAKLANTPAVGNQQFTVTLTRADGATVVVPASECIVDVSQISVGATAICRTVKKAAISNVAVTLALDTAGATVVRETVSLDQSGVLQGLKTKLQAGKPYKFGIKVPGGLRKVVTVTPVAGTTIIPNISIPVGDISPPGGDGQITAADGIEFLRQWRLIAGGGEKPCDLNDDEQCNSVDWTCYKLSAGKKEDPEPGK